MEPSCGGGGSGGAWGHQFQVAFSDSTGILLSTEI